MVTEGERDHTKLKWMSLPKWRFCSGSHAIPLRTSIPWKFMSTHLSSYNLCDNMSYTYIHININYCHVKYILPCFLLQSAFPCNRINNIELEEKLNVDEKLYRFNEYFEYQVWAEERTSDLEGRSTLIQHHLYPILLQCSQSSRQRIH